MYCVLYSECPLGEVLLYLEIDKFMQAWIANFNPPILYE